MKSLHELNRESPFSVRPIRFLHGLRTRVEIGTPAVAIRARISFKKRGLECSRLQSFQMRRRILLVALVGMLCFAGGVQTQ